MSNRGLDDEFVNALNASDGKVVWSVRIGKVGNPDQNPNFPAARSTPTVDGALLYALGSDGDLVCLESATGKVRWKRSLRTDVAGMAPRWAYAESPLVDGDVLVCVPGGNDATVVAFDKRNGNVIWKSAVPGGGTAGYASLIIDNICAVVRSAAKAADLGVNIREGDYGKPESLSLAGIDLRCGDTRLEFLEDESSELSGCSGHANHVHLLTQSVPGPWVPSLGTKISCHSPRHDPGSEPKLR
jgi:outer membrane protein assembly factor BamB